MAYIDRDKLLKELSTMYKPLTTSMTVGYDHAIADVVVVVHEQPTADMVEVVRCKDCRYWYPDTSENIGYCFEFMTSDKDGFCKWGERRDDGREVGE